MGSENVHNFQKCSQAQKMLTSHRYVLLSILNVVMLCWSTRVLRLREVRDQWVEVLAVCTLEHENLEKWSCC